MTEKDDVFEPATLRTPHSYQQISEEDFKDFQDLKIPSPYATLNRTIPSSLFPHTIPDENE